jgi:hypothetical protein
MISLQAGFEPVHGEDRTSWPLASRCRTASGGSFGTIDLHRSAGSTGVEAAIREGVR